MARHPQSIRIADDERRVVREAADALGVEGWTTFTRRAALRMADRVLRARDLEEAKQRSEGANRRTGG